ncbi:hypothetical protein [Limnohabitans curvus]|uniref:hypothetical protein n=1 Tax=Limnohabitans curvus TaxID=323423 RepID=UPI0011B23487|nr:hypothetical protein [Limnohabitans curvus]
MSSITRLLGGRSHLIGQILAGRIKLGLNPMYDVGHALDLATLRGHGRLIIPVDDLMEQLGIPLDRSHSFIQPGLEGHDWVP